MRCRVEIRTDDPELIEVLDRVRNRARFVKRALKLFISTKQGKETLRAMSKLETKNPGRKEAKAHCKRKEPAPPPSEKGKKDGYDFDRFL